MEHGDPIGIVWHELLLQRGVTRLYPYRETQSLGYSKSLTVVMHEDEEAVGGQRQGERAANAHGRPGDQRAPQVASLITPVY